MILLCGGMKRWDDVDDSSVESDDDEASNYCTYLIKLQWLVVKVRTSTTRRKKSMIPVSTTL